MTTNAPRAPIDFDAFERDMQPSFLDAPPATEAAKPDPLAELARIVGQDDPFRALLEARGTVPPPSRAEPILLDTAREPDPVRSPAEPSPAEAFDRYLASVEQNLHENHFHETQSQDAADFVPQDRTPLKSTLAKSRKRARLVQVGAGLGVLVACVSGALALKGMGDGLGSSGPVTVLADKSPLKIAPEKADGVDIPDQNKQIYERNAKDGQIKVVNREEQPLDVAQAARVAASENPPQGGATPGSTGLLTESLGEPRRIRTVSVKPDTPPPAMSRPTAVQNEPQSADTTPETRSSKAESRHASIAPIPTMVLPDGEGTATPAAATPRAPRVPNASTPRREPVAAAATTPAAEPEASEAEPAAKPAPRRALPRRVASVGPEAGMPAAEAEPAAAPTPTPTPAPTTTASVGGYAVQLGVRNSAADARAALQQLQAKHSQLAGKPELIRQAELNGKSFYRVRVGPLSKGEAASLCASLKEAGSACFVAAN